MLEFTPFPKIARLTRECVITEKIDGTNAAVVLEQVGDKAVLVAAQSRSKIITPDDDNYGFAKWAWAHAEELSILGPGTHFGEWWGSGIQRGYDLPKGEKRFSLFNTGRWNDENKPACCHVVPMMFKGPFETEYAWQQLERLKKLGSFAAKGFMNPEGIIIYHIAADLYFKKTLHKDDEWKGKSA